MAIPLGSGWGNARSTCLHTIKVIYSNQIIEYSIISGTNANRAICAVYNMVDMLGDVSACIVHSNRGLSFYPAYTCVP